MLTGLRFAALGALLGLLGGVEPVLQGIILVAAAGASLGWIFVKVLRPLAAAALRTFKAVDALEDLPGFMNEQRTVNTEVKARLDKGSENFELLNQRMSLAERAAWSVATDSAKTAEHTQALVRELDVPTRREPEE